MKQRLHAVSCGHHATLPKILLYLGLGFLMQHLRLPENVALHVARSQFASTTNAPPYTKLKEIGNAINLGSCAWLKFAGILSMLHEMEQFVLDAFTCTRLDGALCMNCIAPGPILCKTSCQSHVHHQNTNSSNRMQIDATKLPPNDCID